MKRFSLILVSVFFASLSSVAQVKDSAVVARDSAKVAQDSAALAKKNKKKIYSYARRASIMSAILPGLGQGYNKKFWKIPIIYAGLGGFGYLFIKNNSDYVYYRKNLLAITDSDPATENETFYDQDQLQILKNDFKKSRDLGLIGMGIIYILNIIDANVDGHLRTFDVSDDLSMSIEPWSRPCGSNYRTAVGLSIKLNFK